MFSNNCRDVIEIDREMNPLMGWVTGQDVLSTPNIRSHLFHSLTSRNDWDALVHRSWAFPLRNSKKRQPKP